MTDQQLLDKAIQDYPVGTVVKPIGTHGHSDTTYTLQSKPYLYDTTGGTWIIADVNLYCPINKLWAEIIKPIYNLWI